MIFTPTKAGTYYYYCTTHEGGMFGELEVTCSDCCAANHRVESNVPLASRAGCKFIWEQLAVLGPF